MSNLPSPEEMMRRACEVRDEDQQQANTARRVGALLCDLVTAVSSALPLTSWRVTRSKASVAVEYAVPPADGGAAVTLRVELPAATDGAAGVMSAAQAQALGRLPALLRGRDAENSAYTDPFIWLGEYSAATHGADYLRQFNDALDALCGEEGDDAGARRWTGRVRATVDGRNVEIHQYVTHFARRVFTQTIEGNVAVGEDGRVTLLPAGNYASLTRSCDGGEWTPWQAAQLPAEDLSRRAYLTDDAAVSEDEILIRMKNFVTGRQDGALILPGATAFEAGLMTAADKVKVNDIPQPQVSSEGSGKAFVYSMSDTNDARCVMTMRNTDIFQNAGKLHFRRGYWSTAAEGGKYITREIPAATPSSDGVMPKEVFARLGTGASIREGTPTATQVPVVYPDWAAGGTRSFTLGAATSARAGLMTAADKRKLDLQPDIAPTPIAVRCVEGRLRVTGYEALAARGFRPVVFRRVKSTRTRLDADGIEMRYRRKGWACYGGPEAVKIDGDGTVLFSTAPTRNLKVPPGDIGYGFSPLPLDTLARPYRKEIKNKEGEVVGIEYLLPWGRKNIVVHAPEVSRQVRLAFALGFVRDGLPYNEAVTFDDLVSTPAEFHVYVKVIAGKSDGNEVYIREAAFAR